MRGPRDKSRDQHGLSAGLDLAAPLVEVERRADESLLVRSPAALLPYARCAGVWLRDWAERAPDRLFLAERTAVGWRRVSYAEALAAARAIGQGLLDRGLSAERPLVILSDNGIDHALLALGAMLVGIPYAPISPAYSLVSRDHAKLKAIFDLLQPGLVFVDAGPAFANAIEAVRFVAQFELVASTAAADGDTSFAALLATRPSADVDAVFGRLSPDSIAKFLFTSGSTGDPKGVINTHRMLCSNQQAIVQCWPFLSAEPPVIVDWLPWSHTFGGNHNFNMVLANGGTLYIDGGKPAPALFGKTIANLKEISPTLYFNVPRGFDALATALEQDAALADTFFARLKLIFYAGAALPQAVWERLHNLSSARRKRVFMASAWGSTETAPLVTSVHFPIPRAGVIGLPAPGCELLLTPNGDKLEMRVRGPNVTPGYWKRPDLTAAAFDPEGFYKIGDAGRLADPADPSKGVEFDGRVSEDFKLASGTWVHVGTLRVKAISALAPVAQDIVVCGHDRDEVGFLVFPDLARCRSLCADLGQDVSAETLLRDQRVKERVREGLRSLKHAGLGSSSYASRALLLSEPPSIDANEITDKGYINQRAVLIRRAESVRRLCAGAADDEVVLI
jgi:feruloyl-CoA synthase